MEFVLFFIIPSIIFTILLLKELPSIKENILLKKEKLVQLKKREERLKANLEEAKKAPEVEISVGSCIGIINGKFVHVLAQSTWFLKSHCRYGVEEALKAGNGQSLTYAYACGCERCLAYTWRAKSGIVTHTAWKEDVLELLEKAKESGVEFAIVNHRYSGMEMDSLSPTDVISLNKGRVCGRVEIRSLCGPYLF